MASRSKPAPANKIFLFDMRESLPEEYEYEVNVIARAVGRDAMASRPSPKQSPCYIMSLRAVLPWHRPPGQVWRSNLPTRGDCFPKARNDMQNPHKHRLLFVRVFSTPCISYTHPSIQSHSD